MTPQDILDQLRFDFVKNKIPIPDKIIESKLHYMSSVSALGKCRIVNGIYIIYLSKYAMKNEEQIQSILAHELVHTIYGCMNHGKKFKKYADIVYEKLGIHIDSRAKQREAEISGIIEAKTKKAKYILECQKCNTIIYRQRKSNLVLYPERYRCKCGGKFNLKKIMFDSGSYEK